MNGGGIGGTLIRCGCLAVAMILIGCSEAPRIDVLGDIDRASGIDNALVIRRDTALASSEDGQPEESLSLDSALRRTLSRDPRIRAAVWRVRVAQADAQQARLLPNPILNLDLRFPEAGNGSHIFEATLTGDLLAVVSMPGRVKAADQRLRAAAADALSSLLEVILEIREAYSAAQAADSQIMIAQRRGEILQRLRDLANNRRVAGEGTQLDVITLDAARLQSELELSDLRLTRTQHRLVLARLIGRPSGHFDWKLDSWSGAPEVTASESSWINAAVVSRPEIQSRAWELGALGEEVQLARLEPLQGGEIGAHGEHDNAWAVGPTITTPLPVFDFGQVARKKAVALREVAHHELNQQRLEVIEEVRAAYAGYIASLASLRAAQDRLLPLQEQQRAQAELAYRNGEADLTTILLAETGLQETRAKVVELQQKLTEAVIKLERAAGGAGAIAALKADQPTNHPGTSRPTSNAEFTP